MSCYHCENASSPEECLQIKVCQPNQLSCETVVRKRDGNIISISKGCKQTESCVNNMFNPINFWTPSECNDEANGDSTCTCCCHNNKCNTAEDCTQADRPNITCDPLPSFGLTLTCTGNNLGDTCQYSCPETGQTPDFDGKMVCRLIPGTTKTQWTGETPTSCVDDNECEDKNGNCQQLCIDKIGGHECACYDNYDPSTDAKYDLLFVVDVSDSVTDNIWRYYQGRFSN